MIILQVVAFVALIVTAVGAVFIRRDIRNAPDGIEDETGFHVVDDERFAGLR